MKYIRRFFSKRSSYLGQQELELAVQAFLQATTPAEFRQIIEENPELLTDKAEALLRRLAQVESQTEVIRKMEECRHLLARCREEGVEAVFPIAGWGCDLLAPVMDAHEFANLLKTQLGVSQENIILLTDSSATRNNILADLQESDNLAEQSDWEKNTDIPNPPKT
jgi:hypothetical protein